MIRLFHSLIRTALTSGIFPAVCAVRVAFKKGDTSNWFMIMHCSLLKIRCRWGFAQFVTSANHKWMTPANWRPCLITTDSTSANRLGLCSSLSYDGSGKINAKTRMRAGWRWGSDQRKRRAQYFSGAMLAMRASIWYTRVIIREHCFQPLDMFICRCSQKWHNASST